MIHNYKQANNKDVEKWLLETIPELTAYQKSKIFDDEIIRFSPFDFFEPKKKVTNFWLRLTVIFTPFLWILLMLGLPFNFIFTGSWGYKNKHIAWYLNWIDKI